MKEYIVANIKIRENRNGGFVVIGDTEKFGKQEILFESPFYEECIQYVIEHTKGNSREKIEKQIKKVLANLPEKKKEVLKKALARNMFLTSSYVLENLEVQTFIEGIYLKFEGCKTSFNIFLTRQGKVIRKPKKLNILNTKTLKLSENLFLHI